MQVTFPNFQQTYTYFVRLKTQNWIEIGSTIDIIDVELLYYLPFLAASSAALSGDKESLRVTLKLSSSPVMIFLVQS